MKKEFIELVVVGRPAKLEIDNETPFVSFKIWYGDGDARKQWGAWVSPDTTPEELDALLLTMAKVAFLPLINEEALRTFG